MKKDTCRKCGGFGFDYIEENGRECRDACYHCGTTGFCDQSCCNDMRESNRLAQLDQVWYQLANLEDLYDRGGMGDSDDDRPDPAYEKMMKLRRIQKLLLKAGDRRNNTKLCPEG